MPYVEIVIKFYIITLFYYNIVPKSSSDDNKIININYKINNTISNAEKKEEIQKLDLVQLNRYGPSKRDSKILSFTNIKKEKEENKENININEINNKDSSEKEISDENYKKINLFEFREIKNTVEYYLNCSLKNITPISDKEVNKASDQSLIEKNNGNNELNNIANGNLKNTNFSKIISTKFLENNESSSFIVLEHKMPVTDEEQISKVLNSSTYFQDQNQNLIESLLTELVYLTVPKDTIIYNTNDISNYFYIVNKGKVKLIKIGKNHEEKKEEEKIEPKLEYKKTNKLISEWESFGEISFFTGKNREEEAIAIEDVELYLIDSESCRELLKKNNEIILKEKYDFLNNISIFESLDKISKYNVAQKLIKKEYPPNTKIISYGEIGDKLYIIKEGIVSCKIGLKEIRKIGNNEYFGENTLLIEARRSADIITLQRCICYELTKEDLKEALSDDYVDIILFCFFNYSINNNSEMKQNIIESLLPDIFKCFSLKQYSKRELICDKNNPDKLKQNPKRIIIVVSGSIYLHNKVQHQKGSVLGADIFNDYNNKNISEEIVAYPDCITLEATIDDLAKVMKIDLNKEKPYNILRIINKLKKSYLFKNLSENTLEAIAKNIKKEKFNKGDTIIQEGTSGNTFYLISKGKVTIMKEGKPLRILDTGECLGEKSLLSNDSLRTASAIAEEKVICYVINKKEFDIILKEPKTREYLLKKLALQNTDIQLSDLYYIKFLGKGKFGSVSLVHNKQNLYAIKAISIRMVEKEKMLSKYFVNERNIMITLDHPFIVKMVKSLKNKKYCFILMEFVNQINLDKYLSKRRTKKNVYETQFYIGSILLMLDYLQKKYIAHRDIKPSNIMIDDNGYLKMIDFGTAKILKDYTSTIIGTPHYIAPEILQGKGYSLSCDFWSIGICMFEIFYGIYPFGNNANEVIDIYKEVLKKRLEFPYDSSKYKAVNYFIKELLAKKVNERICNVSKLKKMEFFEGFDFDKLNDFQLEPPHKPDKKDLSYYLKETKTLYENTFKDEKDFSLNTQKRKKKESEDNYDDSDYEPNWVEAF